MGTKNIAIAKYMIKKGCELNFIEEITGLSRRTVEKLKFIRKLYLILLSAISLLVVDLAEAFARGDDRQLLLKRKQELIRTLKKYKLV
jgi:hypothetical protein